MDTRCRALVIRAWILALTAMSLTVVGCDEASSPPASSAPTPAPAAEQTGSEAQEHAALKRTRSDADLTDLEDARTVRHAAIVRDTPLLRKPRSTADVHWPLHAGYQVEVLNAAGPDLERDGRSVPSRVVRLGDQVGWVAEEDISPEDAPAVDLLSAWPLIQAALGRKAPPSDCPLAQVSANLDGVGGPETVVFSTGRLACRRAIGAFRLGQDGRPELLGYAQTDAIQDVFTKRLAAEGEVIVVEGHWVRAALDTGTSVHIFRLSDTPGAPFDVAFQRDSVHIDATKKPVRQEFAQMAFVDTGSSGSWTLQWKDTVRRVNRAQETEESTERFFAFDGERFSETQPLPERTRVAFEALPPSRVPGDRPATPVDDQPYE